jgi:hypothetical protein
MSEERKAALKELEHPDVLQQILACLWLLNNSIEVAELNHQFWPFRLGDFI